MEVEVGKDTTEPPQVAHQRPALESK
jgi:hypothetical protein